MGELVYTSEAGRYVLGPRLCKADTTPIKVHVSTSHTYMPAIIRVIVAMAVKAGSER